MNFNLPAINYGTLRAQLDTAKSGNYGDRLSFMKVEPQMQVFFYILPPWSAATGRLAKEVFECYNLPPMQGKKRSIHTSWQTHESVEPGISAQDPILKVVREIKELLGDKTPNILPSRKFQINIILRSHGKLDSSGQMIPSTYVQVSPPKVCVIALTPPAFTTLSNMVIAAGESPEGRPDNPLAAVCYCLSREEKAGQGGGRSKTIYTIGVEGRMVAGKGIVPDRHNLVELFGEKFVETAYSTITDLDAAYPLPSESQRLEAQHWSSHIKGALTAKMGGTAPRTVSGAVHVQSSVPQTAAPVAPVEQSPPAAAPAPSLPNEPFFDTLPKNEAPTPAPAPPADAQAVSGKDIMSKDLGLDSPPKKAGGLPVCFEHVDDVSKSPNSRWCNTCTFKMPCKAKAGMKKA